MPRIDQLMHQQAAQAAGKATAYYGTITEDIPNEGSDVFVDIPSLGVTEGPCRWTPRATGGGIILPQAGNEALVAFDDRNIPWILLYLS